MPHGDAHAPHPSAPPAAAVSRGGLSPAWRWVPSLYFAEAVPYALVMTVSVVLYKKLGISNDDIAFYTSLLYLPWVVKPLWSPIVDVVGTKRRWIIGMEFAIALGIAGVAVSLPGSSFFAWSLLFFWLLAFSSSTHDIAADGFYMLGQSPHEQAWFVGVRSSFYRLGLVAGLGLLVRLAGMLERHYSATTAWSNCFLAAAGGFFLLAVYHQWALPRPERRPASTQALAVSMVDSIISFFRKRAMVIPIAYLLLYRFAEAQIAKIAPLFMLDKRSAGGLAMATEDVGDIYGTVGVLMLVIGGILGGIVAARDGLKRWLVWMAVAINLPNFVYVYLAFQQPESRWLVTAAVAVEQFGYGFGFAGYMLYMLYISRGEHETAHYAICTGLMALGMMIPGLFCGKLQEFVGYEQFFVWIMIATIPSFVVTFLVPIDADFGRKLPAGKEAEGSGP